MLVQYNLLIVRIISLVGAIFTSRIKKEKKKLSGPW